VTRESDPHTYAIIGAGLAVHDELGCGFLEAVYRAALVMEFNRRGIPFVPEVALPIGYKGTLLPLGYRVDFVCYESVLVEVKAVAALGPIEHAQAINYLRASGCRRALLLNFGAPSLEHRRLVYGPAK
jgi:GxxExxY protein